MIGFRKDELIDVKKTHDELEQRVEQRTLELNLTFKET